MNECDLFIAALEKPSPSDRDAFLDQACGADTALRRRVQLLLESNSQAGDLLEKPALAGMETVCPPEREVATEAVTLHGSISLDFLLPADDPGALGRIGPYLVAETVGRGGMGIVLKALDTRLDRTVAVKVLAPELAASASARKRFLREARSAAAIVHPNVVTIHAVDDDKLPYLVMEYVAGPSLRDLIEMHGSLAAGDIIRIGSQIASGLAAAHSRGIIHRDIKPANILLPRSEVRDQKSANERNEKSGLSISELRTPASDHCAKLTDFGLARAVGDLDITRTGEIAGTPQYMSPEQARGDTLDARSDLFSLGSVLYAMCTGRSPFRADNPAAVIHRVCYADPQPIHELNTAIPNWLSELINRLLTKEPASRPQTAQEVADLLQRGEEARSAEWGTQNVQRVPVVAPRSALRVPRWAFLALVAAAIFLLAALGVWVTIKDKHGKEIARIEVPDAGTVIIEPDKEHVGNVLRGVPGATPAAPAERGVFVLLGSPGRAERNFDTLLQAVQGSSDGDTIEVCGNGPFVTEAVTIKHPLAIRAAGGFRPVIQLSQSAILKNSTLVSTRAPLVLEGLELQRLKEREDRNFNPILRAYGAAICMANCRVVGDLTNACISMDSPQCRLTNCEFLSRFKSRIDFVCGNERRLIVNNCVLNRVHLGLHCDAYGVRGMQVQFSHCTCGSTAQRSDRFGSHLVQLMGPSIVAAEKDREQPAATIEVSKTLIVSDLGLTQAVNPASPGTDHATTDLPSSQVLFCSLSTRVTADAIDSFVRHYFRWRGEHNVYPPDADFVRYTVDDTNVTGPYAIKSLEQWRKLWDSPEHECLEGIVKFQGGNVIRGGAPPPILTPDDFRLREGSAGYRAGPDGKDLGADIDLVGPGPAYERWKKTPAYQEWLREIAATGK